MMPGVEDQAGFRTCALAGRGLSVKYSTAVLEEILKAALDGLLSFPFGGLEVGGVLYGGWEGGAVRIVTSRPVACEHSFGPGYTLSESDEAGLRAALEGSADPALAGLVPVGWYHSHTRSGLVLSAADMELHQRYFPEPWQVAVVVQPGYAKPSRIGWFVRAPDGTWPETPGFEFQAGATAAAKPPAASEAGESPRGTEAQPPPEPLAAVGEQAQPAVEPPLVESLPTERPGGLEERRWGWIWAVVAVGLITASGGLFLPGLWRKAPAPVALALRLVEKDGRLDIRWDGGTPVVRQAQRGWLEITDGLAEVVFPLDAKLLQAGSWSMVRQSPEVRVRLKVQTRETEAVEESANFLGPPPQAAATPGPQEGAQEQVAKLRAELESQLAESSRLEQRLKELAKEPRPAAPVTAPKPAPRRVFQAPQRVARLAQKEVLGPPEIMLPPSLPTTGPVQAGRQPESAVVPPPPETPRPAAAEAAKPAPAPRGPRAGKLIWTGALPGNSVLTIENRRPSNGHLTGELPSAPHRIGASPAELAAGGLTVYSANPRFARQPFNEPPGPQNGWNRTVYRYDPRLARDLVVVEAPGAQNGWNRIVLRSGDRSLSVILFEWELIP